MAKTTTQSGKLEKVAELAMRLGGKHLADYGSARSRHDFTQRQLMSLLILRAYLKTTYRGLVELLEGHSRLRAVLGMQDKLPHYTTLQKFSARSAVLKIADAMIAQIGQAALRAQGRKQAEVSVAVDATGMETSVASAHFVSRSGRQRRRWVKVSLVVVCGLLFPTGMVLGWGPSSDKSDAPEVLEKSFAVPLDALPQRLYGDAGYDADWIHAYCREEHGVEAIIKPATCRSDGTLGGTYRSKMTKTKLKRSGYGNRWQVESFFSGLKRTTGSALSARKDITLHHEAAFRVLAYTLNRR
jgi:hypothetical protein